jgi:multimeric flavodoxin WrbA
MKIYAINGGPRKKWNTVTMCNNFLEGATSVGDDVETEMIHLYDFSYKGCISCFGCKLKGGSSYGKCAVKDDLQEILIKISMADGVVFGSPIYFDDVTGYLRSFLERLLFPYLSFEKNFKKIAPKKIKTAVIYTMNVTEKQMRASNYESILGHMEGYIERIFSKPQIIYAFNTYEFDDYNKYEAEAWSEREKSVYRKEQFPIECHKAFIAGKEMAEDIQRLGAK